MFRKIILIATLAFSIHSTIAFDINSLVSGLTKSSTSSSSTSTTTTTSSSSSTKDNNSKSSSSSSSLSSLLSGLTGSSSSSSSSSSDNTTTQSSSSSGLSSLLSGLGSTISNLTSTSNFDTSSLVGTWDYTSPAVSFKGDNALSNVTGAAGSTVIENKLSSYYSKFGLTSLVLTVSDDLSFQMKLKKGTLKGTIEKDGDELVFNFKAFGSYKIGKIACMATKSGSTLNLTFDASKIISIANTVASISNMSTFKTAASLLSSYDNIYVGFKLKKSN